MKRIKLNPILVATALALGLGSQGTVRAQAGDEATTAKPLSRAEVMADLHVWRESGLAQFQGIDDPSVPFLPQYLQARDRYERMLASPQFAELVLKYGGTRTDLASARR